MMHFIEVRGNTLSVKHGYVLMYAWNIVWFSLNC